MNVPLNRPKPQIWLANTRTHKIRPLKKISLYYKPSFLRVSLIPLVVGVITADIEGPPRTPDEAKRTVNWFAQR